MASKVFRCISIDPPWPESGGGRIKRGADRHYNLLKSPHDILAAIYQSDVWGVALHPQEKVVVGPNRDGCHLWLWATNNYLEDGLFIMKALGFRYVNKLTWGKMKNGKIQKGIGQYFFGSDEVCLFGVMGRLARKERVPSLLLAERDQHSRKPAEAYKMMETVSPGPRLEMFARGPRKGWTTWGDQASAS